MQDLINKIEALKNSEISTTIRKRIKDFKSIDIKSNEELFKEMCFCLLTANFNAEKSIKIQEEMGECFLTDSKEELSKKLKHYSHRFPNTRAEYITQSQICKDKLNKVVEILDKKILREWIVNNVKGLGYKEASHFLRNVGFDDYAIIDFHIIDVLVDHQLISKPKNLSKKNYLEIEKILRTIAKKTDLTLAELDLYLWYMETGKVLK
jgi:N-glycosylase/DNA lyase